MSRNYNGFEEVSVVRFQVAREAESVTRTSGLFFNDIAQRFNQKVNHPETFPQTLKYYIYSTVSSALFRNLQELSILSARSSTTQP